MAVETLNTLSLENPLRAMHNVDSEYSSDARPSVVAAASTASPPAKVRVHCSSCPHV